LFGKLLKSHNRRIIHFQKLIVCRKNIKNKLKSIVDLMAGLIEVSPTNSSLDPTSNCAQFPGLSYV